MGTSSRIGITTDDNHVLCIYCHWDGYLDGVGYVLKHYYTTKEKVQQLIDLGDISYLKKNVSPDKSRPHTFDNPQEDVTVAYHRDRGENWKDCEPWMANSVMSYGLHSYTEFCYLYDTKDNCWKVWKNGQFSAY